MWPHNCELEIDCNATYHAVADVEIGILHPMNTIIGPYGMWDTDARQKLSGKPTGAIWK